MQKMPKALTAILIMTFSIGAFALNSASAQELNPAHKSARKAIELWETLRRTDIDSPAYEKTRRELEKFLSNLPEDQKVIVAAVLMKPSAEDDTNAAALEMFGKNGLPVDELGKILALKNRALAQRVLLRTYAKFARNDYRTMLNEDARRKIIGMVAKRMETLTKEKNVSYGEQRLLTQMIQSILNRYVGTEGTVPQYKALLKALNDYVATKRVDDTLAASITGWLTMIKKPDIDSVTKALQYLGHWDVSVRRSAARYLTRRIQRDKRYAKYVIPFFAKKTADLRDEARAAAISVFANLIGYDPKIIVPKMVHILLYDRGVLPQQAAADTLISFAFEAQNALPMLADGLDKRVPGPGPKRANNIFQTMRYLVNSKTTPAMKTRLVSLATKYLYYCPDGALRLLKALGESAKPAVPAIEKFRNEKADRFLRQLIDDHILPAIDPKAAAKYRNN